MLAFGALTLGNAFFVAAEFALVTVNRAEIEHQAERGDVTAGSIRAALRRLSFQLSGAQLGITITALLAGYLAEPALAHIFLPPVQPLGDAARPTAHVLALGLATVLSVLFGELIPKNAALARPMTAARLTAGAMQTFSAVFGWVIRALNGCANWLVRRLGVQPQEELASARSPEELGLLAAYSAKEGVLSEETALLLRRTIRFGDKRAAEAMTPRVNVIGIAATASVQEVIDLVGQTGKSRFPVYEQTLDQIVGVVAVIDVLRVPTRSRSLTAVRRVMRNPVLVPGSLDLDGVLGAMQVAGDDVALVIDEYGGTDGIVTIEDLVEELVGEISDEHDRTDDGARTEPGLGGVLSPNGERAYLVEGVLREDELEEQTGFRLPPGPYETLAGFLMAQLGHIPTKGEKLTVPGWHFTVIEVRRRRIERVRVVAMPEEQQ